MNVAVISWGREGKAVYDLLSRNKQYKVVCVVEENSEKWNDEECAPWIVSSGRAVCMFEEGKIEYFIVPSMAEAQNYRVIKMLEVYHINIDNLLYASAESLWNTTLSDEERISMINSYKLCNELDAMEIHVAEHCNLNCKNCSMFCGLVKKEAYPDYNEFEKGIILLKKYFQHVKIFRIIGGEPLLNKDLDKYIYKIRDIYPYTDIRLISNGILVKQMSDKLIKAVKECHVTFIVTQYAALKGSIDEIKMFLVEKGITNIVTEVVTEFQKIYNASGNSNIDENFYRCHWKGNCATMYGTQIATCFVPFVIHYLSDQFNLGILETGKIDLEENGLTTQEIRRRMHTPFDLCRYCAPKGDWVTWERIKNKKEMALVDWSI